MELSFTSLKLPIGHYTLELAQHLSFANTLCALAGRHITVVAFEKERELTLVPCSFLSLTVGGWGAALLYASPPVLLQHEGRSREEGESTRF